MIYQKSFLLFLNINKRFSNVFKQEFQNVFKNQTKYIQPGGNQTKYFHTRRQSFFKFNKPRALNVIIADNINKKERDKFIRKDRVYL